MSPRLLVVFLLARLVNTQQPDTLAAQRSYCSDGRTLPITAQVDTAGALTVSCEAPPCTGDTDQATQLGFSNLAMNTYYTGGFSSEAQTYDFVTEITPNTAYGGQYLATVYRMPCTATAPQADASQANPYGMVQCFSGDTLVQTPAGEKLIRDVEVGDLLLSTESRTVQFSRVLMHLHKVDDVETEFVHLKLANGRDLKLTDFHLIYASENCQGSDREVLYVKDLKEGMCVLAMTNGLMVSKQQIVSIGRVTERGYYAPLTATGDVIVNGFVASCHSNFVARILQQSVLRVYSLLEPVLDAVVKTVAATSEDKWSMLGDTLLHLLPSSAVAKFV